MWCFSFLLLCCLNADPPTVTLQRDAWKDQFDEANAAFKAKEFHKAEEAFRQALRSSKEAEKPEQARAFVLNGLVAALVAQDKQQDAEPLAAEAAELWTKVQGFGHPTIGRTYNNLGNIRKSLFLYDKAEDAYRQALTSLERSRERRHPDIQLTLSNLASLHRDLGEYRKAIAVYRQLLLFQFNSLATHPEPGVDTLNELARCHLQLKEVREAEPLARQALQLAQRQLPPNHPLSLRSLATLAKVYQAQDNLSQAQQIAEQALAVTPDNHVMRWEIEATLGDVLWQAGEKEKAENLLSAAVDRLPSDKPPSQHLADLYTAVADVLQMQGKSAKADEMRQRAEDLQSKLKRSDK